MERTMTTLRALALPLAAALFLPACVATSTQTRTWGSPYQDGSEQQQWARYGRVEQVRETVTRQEGNPAGGAVAGAVIGGLIGSAFSGHTHYDAYGRAHGHASGAGALVGAGVGAMVGAASSQGSAESRYYDVLVRFDDGATQIFRYRDGTPFQIGDDVTLTPQGLVRG
jgi:outer membrane lipoprotein SlyB